MSHEKTQTQILIELVKFFCRSDKNKCWPTAKKWTLAEAKDILLKQAQAAEDEPHHEDPHPND